MRLATIFLATLITLTFSGCCETHYVNVPQKCHVPKEPDIVLDHSVYPTQSEILARILKNSTTKDEYIEKLLANQKVCE